MDKTRVISALLLCSAFMSVVAFAVFGADKKMARQGTWRIPERTLFALALLGGSPGAILGMLVFHHKTKHIKFVIGLDRKSTRLNSSHRSLSRMPSSA